MARSIHIFPMRTVATLGTGLFAALVIGVMVDGSAAGSELVEQQQAAPGAEFLRANCLDCHSGDEAEAGLDLASLSRDLSDAAVMRRWVRIFDRVHDGEMPPPDSGLSNFTNCVFQRDGASATTSSTCTFNGMTSTNYNGRMVAVSIPIPANYTCDIDTGCWLRVRLSFNNATPTDTTTWSASIDGDPVRLIE